MAALQNGKGGLDPINAVRRAAGLDRLRIVPADPHDRAEDLDRGGQIHHAALLCRDRHRRAGYSATQVEFQVTRWLSLLSTISTLGRQSANVRVSKDY